MKSKPIRATLVLNPKARQGDLSVEEICAHLAHEQIEAELFPVENDDVEAALTRALGAGQSIVIVGGGDGTLSTASTLLAGTELTLGILPLGTANDFARSLGIPHDVEGACAVIAGGHVQPVDVGVANGRRFVNVASVGLPVKVTAMLTPESKKKWGTLAYPIAAVRAFLQQHPFVAHLVIDGRHRRIAWVMQIAVGSGRYYGGGMPVTDTAEPTDGYLNLHVITAPNVGALLWSLRHLRSGRYAQGDRSLRFRAKDVRMTMNCRHRVNIDGELLTHTPLHVTIEPGALRVFVPAPATEKP